MSTTSTSSPIRPWLVTGIVFVYILALSWSIDPSMVYIFLGAATFCFFMALQNWLRTQPWKKEQTGYQQQEKTKTDFSFNFKFNRGQQQRQQRQHQQTSSAGQTQQPRGPIDPQKVAKRVIFGFMAIIGFFVFIGVIGVIFGSDDESEVQYYRDRAELYLDNQQYDSARTYYRLIINRRPDESAPLVGYGKTFYFQEQYDSALVLFNRANALSPDDTDPKLFRGRTYYYQKRYPEALQEAEQLLNDDPGYTEALLLAGDTHYSQQHYDDALNYYEPAYEAGARSLNLCWIMAWIYDEQKKDLEKAIPLYKEALTYDNTVVDIYTRLSQVTKEPEAGEYRRKAAQLQK